MTFNLDQASHKFANPRDISLRLDFKLLLPLPTTSRFLFNAAFSARIFDLRGDYSDIERVGVRTFYSVCRIKILFIFVEQEERSVALFQVRVINISMPDCLIIIFIYLFMWIMES